MQSVILDEAAGRSKMVSALTRPRASTLCQLLLLATLACSGPSSEPLPDAGIPAPVRTVWYFGGPVVPNPKVYVLWWGSPSQMAPELTRSDGGIADFFTGVTNSEFLDGLNEYNTDGVAEQGSDVGDAGTHQHIGRGNFAGAYTLDAGTDGGVNDSMITATLAAALLMGDIPASDENAIYAIFFPHSATVNFADSGVSCVDYGALHYFTPPLPGGVLAYLVIPDCGKGFGAVTRSAAHELVETTTDRLPTPGNVGDYPQAWETLDAYEVADLCQQFPRELSTPDGTFEVQEIWDEEHQTCALTHTYQLDYNISLNPNVATLLNGSPVTFAVNTELVAGSNQALALSVRSPAGITAMLSSSAIQAGQTSSLTLSWDGVSSIKDAQVVVEAAGSTGTAPQVHSASLLVNTDGGN